MPPSPCPLSPWALKSCFEDAPRDLEEPRYGRRCAMVVRFLQIAAALAHPAILDAGLLAFIFSWNEFFFAVILTRLR